MLIENCKLAIKSIKANRLRALLTMLGIIIGVAAVITIMTVGDSMAENTIKEMESWGIQNIGVGISQVDWNAILSEEESKNKMFTPEELHDLTTHFGDKISAVSARADVGSGSVMVDNKKAKVNVVGVSLGYFKANTRTIVGGNYFSEYAFKNGSSVALVNDKFVKQLEGENYKTEDVLGKDYEVDIDSEYLKFTVVGIYEPGSDMMDFLSLNSDSTDVYIPLAKAWDLTHKKELNDVTIVASPDTDVMTFSYEISSYLKEKLATKLGDKLTVDTYTNKTYIESTQKQMKQMTMAFSLIAAIALLVGGIGVMNIMTVSITERTKEIGTRKALGAEDSMIMLQFISEAVILCLIGGLIGMTLGLTLGITAAKLLSYPVNISFTSLYISVGFSTAIGVIFGYSPAKRAAKMNPIDALRYE